MAISPIREAYLDSGKACDEQYSTAERIEFLRCRSCLVAYALKAINEETPESITPSTPILELEFGNTLVYLVNDFEIPANYIRNHHRWELNEWLRDAVDDKRYRITYPAPRDSDFGWFKIHVNKLAGSNLLRRAPDLKDLFQWLRTYPARLSFRTRS